MSELSFRNGLARPSSVEAQVEATTGMVRDNARAGNSPENSKLRSMQPSR